MSLLILNAGAAFSEAVKHSGAERGVWRGCQQRKSRSFHRGLSTGMHSVGENLHYTAQPAPAEACIRLADPLHLRRRSAVLRLLEAGNGRSAAFMAAI